MKIDLSGKVIVITGASTGIGSKLTYKFASEGANIVINYKDDDIAGEELYLKTKKLKSDCILVKANVSEENEVKFLYQETIRHYEKVDILINNAGICSDNNIQFMKTKDWNNVIETNLTGIFLCSRIFSKNMIKRKKGKIINVASLVGQIGNAGQCNYATAKAGVIGFTKSIAKEFDKYGISVNAVCPGRINTGLNNNINTVLEEDYIQSRSLQDYLNFMTLFVSDSIQGVSGQVFNLDSRFIY